MDYSARAQGGLQSSDSYLSVHASRASSVFLSHSYKDATCHNF